MDDEIKPILRTYTQKTDIEKIVEHLLHRGPDNVELSDALQKKLNDLRVCRDLIYRYGSRLKVTSMLMNDYGISQSEAYRQYNDTKEVFNATSEISGRDFYVDMLMGFMIETRNKAVAKEDFRSAASSEKNIMSLLLEFFGGHEAKLYSEIQPQHLRYVFDPKHINANLPDNLEERIEKFLKKKKENPRDTDMFDDAELIDDEQ
jgi:hypothetical protein